MESSTLFQTIADQLIATDDAISMGKMMSAPAITYQGKVFAFFHDDMMTFKLGEAFEPEKIGITNYQLLAPFKTKPPMKAWFSIPYTEHQHWESLTQQALAYIQAS